MFEKFECLKNVELAKFSTIKIGGKAKWLIFPKNIEELKEVLQICEKNKIKTFVLGNGSNVLFDDAGFDGAILNLRHFDFVNILCESREEKQESQNRIKNRKKTLKKPQKRLKNANFSKISTFAFDKFAQQGEKSILYEFGHGNHEQVKFTPRLSQQEHGLCVEVGAGINLFALNLRLAKIGLSGLEFCYGVPATLGGFLVMNGGCFGHEICEIVESVQILQNGKLLWKKKDECDFSYRHSNLQNCVILSAKLRLFIEKTEIIMQNMQFYLQKKRNSQPCDLPSLGSVFKAANGVSVGKILDGLGLKGFAVGGAQVSTKHAGFVVNTGGATAKDVLALVEILEKKLVEIGIKPEKEILVLKEK